MGILATHWFDSVVGTSFSFPVSVLEQDEIYMYHNQKSEIYLD